MGTLTVITPSEPSTAFVVALKASKPLVSVNTPVPLMVTRHDFVRIAALVPEKIAALVPEKMPATV